MSHAGCPECADADHACDLVIIGAGPAGLVAAVNAASEGSMAVSEIHRYLSQPTIPATEGIK